MATCETNGFINHVSTIVTGSAVIPLSNSYTSVVGDEHHRGLKNTSTLMPPRTDYILNCSKTFGDTDRQSQPDPEKSPPLQIQKSLLTVFPPKPDEPICCFYESRLHPSLTPTDICKSTPLRPSLQSPASRFRAYKQRLNQCTSRLHVARARCNTILTHLLSTQPSSAGQQSAKHDAAGDETESSTDDDEVLEDEKSATVSPPHNNEALSRSEESWLCTRAISSSNWFWFLSELERCERHISRLSAIKTRFRLSRLSARPLVVSPHSCSRATPWVRSPAASATRHTPHDLRTITLRPSGSWSNTTRARGIRPDSASAAVAGETTRCSCILPYSGPCINCFNRTLESTDNSPVASPHPVDLLAAARPLGAHIHPKLSLPRDIQLSLRLESRLAAFSPVTFREHKTTIHPARHCPLQPRPTSLVTQLSDYSKLLHSSSSPAVVPAREPDRKCSEESEHA